MKKYLIDTTIFIDYFRGNNKATEFLKEIDDQMMVSGTTIGELLQGVRNKQELKVIEKLVSFSDVIWCTSQIEQLAHDLLSNYNLKSGIGYFDCLIAAHALKNDFQLVTHNIKHFKGIKDLDVVTPPYLD